VNKIIQQLKTFLPSPKQYIISKLRLTLLKHSFKLVAIKLWSLLIQLTSYSQHVIPSTVKIDNYIVIKLL